MKEMFPLRKENQNGKKRHTNKYHINKANTTTYKKSAIPYPRNRREEKREITELLGGGFIEGGRVRKKINKLLEQTAQNVDK